MQLLYSYFGLFGNKGIGLCSKGLLSLLKELKLCLFGSLSDRVGCLKKVDCSFRRTMLLISL